MRSVLAYRLSNAFILAIVVILGLGSKAYSGWGQAWINGYSGDVLYEVFWIWLAGFLWPKQRVWVIALAVLSVTIAIEFSQLIPFPATWKAHIVWRFLLGTHFTWWDLPYYGLGCLLGGWSLAHLQRAYSLKIDNPL